MGEAFTNLQPELVWTNFEKLTQVPRGSGDEKGDETREGISRFMLRWAAENGLTAAGDEPGNVLIKVPASPGMEDRPALALQGHLDMVCEKDEDVPFEFKSQGIRVVRDGDFLRADGTTLGADNGIGVAMAMSLAKDPSARHPALELVFTVDEERGLTGANGLQPGFVTARRLINIDSEEEGHIFVGCAGGADTDTLFPLKLTPLKPGIEAVTIKLTGLVGGHSGLTIHENRANALKTLAALLMTSKRSFSLCKLEGGDKHNAIPREAVATIAGRQGLAQYVGKLVKKFMPAFQREFSKTDPKAEFIITPAAASEGLSTGHTKRMLRLMLALPHGVDTMSRDILGLVETSCNMARVRWEADGAHILHSSRSSVESALARIRERIACTGLLAGAKVFPHEGYPGWQPNMSSALLAKAKEVYARVAGKEAEVKAIHAGLECGIIGMKYPGIDMISIGPDMFDVHSPRERLSVPSTARFYAFLKELAAAV